MGQLEDQVSRMGGEERSCAELLVRLMAAGLAAAWGEPFARVEAPAGDGIWERVHAMARRNSVEGLAWAGVRACGVEGTLPDGLADRWGGDALLTEWRRLQFDVERERVLAALEAAGLAVLPLKGAAMAGLYPDPTMRSMADNDILYGRVEPLPPGDPSAPGWRVSGAAPAEREASVRAGMSAAIEAMRSLGYEPTEVGAGPHDSFARPPIFNFELHRTLFSSGSLPYARLLGYYGNPWSRARQDDDDPLLFSFSDEDAYVYTLAHAFKHFDSGGCGPRALADEAVLLRAWGQTMDWGYVAEQLEATGLAGFEARLADAARALLLGEGEPAAEDWELALFMCGSGTYGNIATRVERSLERGRAAGSGEVGARLRYVWGRLWLTPGQVADVYPFVAAHPWLRPLLLPVRVGKALTTGFAHACAELRALKG